MGGLRSWLVLLVLGPLAAPAYAGGDPAGKPVLDLWDAAYLEGGKAGYVHTSVRELQRDGQKLFRTTQELHLTVKRFNETIQLRAWTGTEETPAGKVVGVFMKQHLGQNKHLSIVGTVAGNQLRLTLDGTPIKPAPWDDRVLGLYRQQGLFKDKKLKPGDRFSYPSFEPSVNLVVTAHVEVKDFEEVASKGTKEKARLLRVEVKPEKIDNVQLPTVVYWLDGDWQPVRSRVEVPGLGQMVLERGPRAEVLAPGPVATLTDIGVSQLLRLNRKIARPYDANRAVFRIILKGEDEPTSTFARDQRQQIKTLPRKDSFELHVGALRTPKAGVPAQKAKEEFLQPSYFINSADERVKELARQAVGSAREPWDKAQRIEKWVHGRMTVKSHEALATADHVARTLEGDCTEFAMLTAAMCRAQGVPSRTAIGLVYADTKQGAVMAFHMWTEVWIDSQWLALDATLGRGSVGATHLKITDHSWHETRTLNPLLPVVRVLGKMSIEVVSVE